MYSQVCFWSLVLFCVAVLSSASETDEDYNEVSRGLNPKSLLEKITSSLMTRSDGSSSQVLSLNLSNLLILVLLKALIFAAGSIGAGGWKGGHGYGRSNDDSESRLVTDTEVLLYLGYLAGKPGKYECLQNIACNQPQQAMQYVKAGGLLLKAAKIIPNVIELDSNHEQTLQDLKKAAEFGQNGGNCETEFICASSEKIK